MSTQNMLEITLAEILHIINPLRRDLETRMRIIDELRDVVSSIDSLKGATVEPFGSFLSQLFSRWGDLDISVELPNGSHILVPAKKHKQTLLGDLQKTLRKTGSFRRLQFVTHARVPILKLESKIQNISCDISINNLSGQMKSKFLLWISHIDRRFRDMVLLVKEWAKANGINNPRSGTFNSYSLSLLVIFHFQTCAPAILPRLADLYPGNISDELTGVRADVERRIEEIAVGNIERFKKQRRPNHSSLSALFISFLGKFLDISTRIKEQGISTFRGRWENISTNTRWLPRTYAIFIEDPFEQPVNTARGVSLSRLARISEAFRNTYYLLIDPSQSRNTFIPSLVRQEISHFFPGAAFVIPLAGPLPDPWLNQSAPHRTHSFIPFEHQFQTARRVNQTKNSKVQNGKQVSQGRQVPRVKPGRQRLNVYRQKTSQQGQEEVPPILSMIGSPKNLNVKNALESSQGKEAPRVKPGRYRQNADEQKTAQQCHEQVPQAPNSKVAQERQASRVIPGKKRQNVYREKTSQECQGQTPLEPSQVVKPVVKPKNMKVQNGKQFSVGRHVPRVKIGRKCQNAGKQNTARERRVQLPPAPSYVVHPKNLKVQNGKKLSPGRELSRVKPGRKGQNVDRQRTVLQCQGQVSPVPSQVVNPPWPHTLQPRANNDVVVQPSFKPSLAAQA